MTGTFPSEIGRLSGLTKIKVTSNSLTGTIPSNYYQLSNLDSFLFGENKLSGSISNKKSFSSIGTVTELHDILINGTVPDVFETFLRLFKLEIHSTNLSGEIPIGQCEKNLMVLSADCAGENPKGILLLLYHVFLIYLRCEMR